MCKMVTFYLLPVLLAFSAVVNGLPSGAPNTDDVCKTLLPEHRVDPQTGKAPFKIIAKLLNNKQVNVTLVPNKGGFIRGFIIQARSANNTEHFVDGTFTPGRTSQTIDCFSKQANTLTHKSPKKKRVVSALWKPDSKDSKKVIFVATVATSKETYYVGITSNAV